MFVKILVVFVCFAFNLSHVPASTIFRPRHLPTIYTQDKKVSDNKIIDNEFENATEISLKVDSTTSPIVTEIKEALRKSYQQVHFNPGKKYHIAYIGHRAHKNYDNQKEKSEKIINRHESHDKKENYSKQTTGANDQVNTVSGQSNGLSETEKVPEVLTYPPSGGYIKIFPDYESRLHYDNNDQRETSTLSYEERVVKMRENLRYQRFLGYPIELSPEDYDLLTRELIRLGIQYSGEITGPFETTIPQDLDFPGSPLRKPIIATKKIEDKHSVALDTTYKQPSELAGPKLSPMSSITKDFDTPFVA